MKIIVAIDNKNGIGLNNKIPWYIPDDLKYFRKMTTNTLDPEKKNAVIMGRVTWKSLPKKILKNRINIVLTRNKDKYKQFETDILFFENNIESALQRCDDSIESIWIIGGSKIYNKVINDFKNQITDLFITQINKNYNCDTFINLPKMKLLGSKVKNGVNYNHYRII